ISLSRRKQGFESPRERHARFFLFCFNVFANLPREFASLLFSSCFAGLNGDRITDYEFGERIFLLNEGLSSADNVRLVASGADTELQIDGDNNGSFETVITLTGTISGSINLSSLGPPNNNVITIVPDTQAPTVTVNIVDASLSDADNTSLVTFEFSENVIG